MVLNDIERKRIESKIAAFVERRRPPEHLRDQVDLAFRFDGRSVEIFEIRPRWDKPAEKMEEAVAKARYIKFRDEWSVYWQRADLQWHECGPKPQVRTVDAFSRWSTKTNMHASSADCRRTAARKTDEFH